MARYSLVTKNYETNKTKVLIEKKPLVEIDKIICENFQNADELVDYFNLSINDDFKIAYLNNREIKYVDVMFKKDVNGFLHSIINNTNDSNIDMRLDAFANYVDRFMHSLSSEKLEYLYTNKYIYRKMYFDLVSYIVNVDSKFALDRENIYYVVKKALTNYLAFRKLYLGLSKYEKMKQDRNKLIDKPMVRKISTENELLNQLFNNGGCDDVFSVFDLDHLFKINDIDELPLDAFCKIKK